MPEQAEFDKFARDYREVHAANIGLSGEEPEYFAEYKVRDVAGALRDTAAPVGRILDFGSGVGTSVPHFRRYFPASRLVCLDVSGDELKVARGRYPAEADFLRFDGRTIPVADESFDLAFAACVFHHIAPSAQAGLLQELRRVLKPGGCLAVYEHNPLNPLTQWVVRTCPFDENAILIRSGAMAAKARAAGFASVRPGFRLFFPRPLATLRPLERFLGWLPLGAQYRVLARK